MKALEALTIQVSLLARNASRAADPVLAPLDNPRPATPYPAEMSRQAPHQFEMFRRPPGAGNEVQCFNCYAFGHFSRDCPLPNPRYPKTAVPENAQAGPQGQDRH